MEMEIGIDHFHESDEPVQLDDESFAETRALYFAIDVVSRMHDGDETTQGDSPRRRMLQKMNSSPNIDPQTEEEREAARYAVGVVLRMYAAAFWDTPRGRALRRVRDQLRIVKHIVSHPNPAERTWCGRAVDAVEPQAQVRSTDMKGHIVCDACKDTADHVRAVLEAGMYPERHRQERRDV